MTKSRLNIVIPCWNASKWLPFLLDSIIAQTYENWKVVAVDDQSTDSTVEVLKKYHDIDSRITYVVREHAPKGASACRNIGLYLSHNADYLMFADADDLYAPYSFEQRVAFMDANMSLDFSVFPAKRFIEEPWDDCDFIIGFTDGQDDLANFLIPPVMPFSMWNCIYRPQSLLKNRLRWDEHLKSLEDSDFAIQTIIKGLKYEYASDARIDYFWRTTEDSITTKIFTMEHLKNNFFLFDKIFHSFNERQREIYEKPLHYWLLTYSENFGNNTELWSAFMSLPWFQINHWFAFRMKIYRRLPVNNKIRHILFPELIQTYLQAIEKHFVDTQQCKKNLLNINNNIS